MTDDELALLGPEQLRTASPPLEKNLRELTFIDAEKKYAKRIDAIEEKIRRSESGQVRSDIERLVPNEGAEYTAILIDGKSVNVTGAQKLPL